MFQPGRGRKAPAQRSVRGVLDILELLAEATDGLALTEIAHRAKLAKSATHRLLTTLCDRGLATQDEATQHYRLTMRLAALGFRFLAETGITEICQPVLDRLAAKTGELARMAIVEPPTMTWVAKAQGARTGLRYDPDMGREVILHATATGKAWLATLPEREALTLVRQRGFGTPTRFGPRAVRSEAELKRELAETRRRGYGIALEEGEPGTAAIACVIRASLAAEAPVVATVSIAGPVVRLTPARRTALAREVAAAARELSSLWPIRRHLEASGRLARSA
jgi:DNA-binding IclR family transcriptional regulator